MLVIARLLDATVRRSLPSLRPAVRIDDATFAAYAERMRSPGMSADTALLTLSAVLVAVLFLVLRSDLPIRDPVTGEPMFLPGDGLGAIAVLLGYAVLGWAGLAVVYGTVRSARTLGDLSRERLAVDVFDTRELLPFGNIALALALAPAGIVVILLLGLGQPGTLLSWTVDPARDARERARAPAPGARRPPADGARQAGRDRGHRPAVERDLRRALGRRVRSARMVPLNQATNTLVPLRTTVSQLTTWPFRNTVAFGRAVLIASAPLVYAALSELIRVF